MVSLLAERKPKVTYGSLDELRSYELRGSGYIPFSDWQLQLEGRRKFDPDGSKMLQIVRKIRQEAGLDK